MQTKGKSILILSITLVIGMLLGVVLSGFVIHNFMNPPAPQFNEEMLFGVYRRMLGSTAFEKPQVDSVIRSYTPRFRNKFIRHRQEMKFLLDSLNADLEKSLTPEERARLEEHFQRFKRRMERRMGKSGYHRHMRRRPDAGELPPPPPPNP